MSSDIRRIIFTKTANLFSTINQLNFLSKLFKTLLTHQNIRVNLDHQLTPTTDRLQDGDVNICSGPLSTRPGCFSIPSLNLSRDSLPVLCHLEQRGADLLLSPSFLTSVVQTGRDVHKMVINEWTGLARLVFCPSHYLLKAPV